jgi:hypothetical protein
MTSSLRAALLLVFATSVLAASAATALAEPVHEFTFTGAVGANWTAKASGTQTFNLNLGRIECLEGGLTGVVPAGQRAPSVKAAYTYANCRSAGFSYFWKVSNCEYELHQPTGESFLKGTLGIVKGSGTSACKTVLESSLCNVTIEAQTPKGFVHYENLTKGEYLNFELSGLQYVEKGHNCPNGPGTFANGFYTGNMEAKELSVS